MEIYNGHVAVSLISDLLTKIETKVYFFFKGDRSFDYCSRSYFWILLAVYITLQTETTRKDGFASWQKAFKNKAKEDNFLCETSSEGSRISGGGGGVGCVEWMEFTPKVWSQTYYFSHLFPKNCI